MEPLHAAALGVIQGLTEFLPVSSSGHLVLLQHLFGLQEPEILFDISLHVGTLVAVCAVFFKEIRSILSALLRLPALVGQTGGIRGVLSENEEIRMMALIVVGSVPTALLGFGFHRIVDQIFGAVWVVGLMLLVTGTLLFATRGLKPSGRSTGAVRFRDALIIGLVQGLAILPGISRSGSTISVALFLGIDREFAGRFSFLLSIPAIFGALLLGIKDASANPDMTVGIILFGALIAAAVGYGALILLLRLVKVRPRTFEHVFASS